MAIQFEKMAKLFVELATDNYFSADKVLKLIDKLGVQSFTAKSLVVQALYQAVYDVSPNQFFRTLESKTALLQAIREAADVIEEQLAIEEEEHIEKELLTYDEDILEDSIEE
ncbi:hypothetical protein BN1013_01215 [Candidatus Rubidus massiliensis]|nr:MAG: hypothetical protein BGO10_09535 [Chlamydia sp. 32-24]CDZ80697.1 hypothetical protein BN1013_01215 [Candidatus Rubidus massiliensis]